MAAPSAPSRKLNLPPDFGQYAAMYITIAAFSFVTLISVSSLWSSGAWLPYLIGVSVFAIITDRCSRQVHPSRAYLISCILIETIIILVLSVLSDYFFLTTMLSFLIVASTQGELPRRQSYGMAFLVLIAITVTYAIGAGMNAAVQIFFGMGAGFVFIIVFTELAQRERQTRQDLQDANQQLAEYAAQ